MRKLGLAVVLIWCGLVVLHAAHPLDPLSSKELRQTFEILLSEQKATTNTLFPVISLKEPSKEVLSGWTAGSPIQRQALVTAYELSRHETYEGVVDLAGKRTLNWRRIRDAQPIQTLVEYGRASQLLQTNELWLVALARRGITNAALVDPGPLPEGVVPIRGATPGVKLLRACPHLSDGHNTWEPVEGLSAIVDVTHLKVLEVLDRGTFPAKAGTLNFYNPEVRGSRKPLKPLVISLPEGENFAVSDHEVRWDRWRFRYSLHPREGLVLHHISWEEAPGKLRTVLYRASVSDLLVPYADTDRDWSWRAYFDASDYGLGYFAQSLKRGVTTPAHSTLLTETLPNQNGGSRVARDVVDIYERDAGILWAHSDGPAFTTGPRARELVIGCLCTVGNYDYRFQWSFRQDGSIEFHVYLTGIMQLKGTHATRCAACAALAGTKGAGTPNDEQAHGVLVSPHMLAPHHQHFFNLRLDFDVDGTRNSVKELNVKTDRRGRKNPQGNGFSLVQTVLSTERQAARDLNMASDRMWVVYNPGHISALGHPTGYGIEPGMNTVPFLSKSSYPRQRAGFTEHHFFATRYRDSERYAGGDYPAGKFPPNNVLSWLRDNESLLNEDLVVWYTMGLTHIARPEDFPVMPAAHASVRLIPKAFFTRNPALEISDTPTE